MKQIFSIGFLCLFFQILSSENSYANSDKLISFCAANDLCGYVDKVGNWVISPKYDATYDFNENNSAQVKLNNKIGLIDNSGNWVDKPNSRRPLLFSAFPKFGLIRQRDNCKPRFSCDYGFVDQNGKWVIQPNFDKLSDFSDNGLAIASTNSKWGVINTSGSWVIAAKFRNLSPFSKDGLAAARKRSKWGLIDSIGNWKLEPKYDDLRIFGNTTIGLIGAKIGTKWGFISKSGNWVIRPQFEDISSQFYNGITVAKLNGKFGLINEKGGWNLKPKHEAIQVASNFGLFAFKDDGKWGLYNSLKQTFLTPSKFDRAPVFSVGSKFSVASINWKAGMIDQNGDWLLEPQYEVIGVVPNADGTVMAGSKGKVGYINKVGNWIIEPKYDWVTYQFKDKLFLLSSKDTYGLADQSGNLLLAPYDEEQIKKLRIKAAQFGSSVNMMHIARMLTSSSPSEAFEWALKAAEQGNADGQNFVAEMYETGKSTTRDLDKAIFWYQKSAEQEFADAQINLAEKYIDGNGVPKDLAKAYTLLNKAKLNGYKRGKIILENNEKKIKEHIKRIQKQRQYNFKTTYRQRLEAQGLDKKLIDKMVNAIND